MLPVAIILQRFSHYLFHFNVYVNAGSQDAEVEITVMILEFILGIKVVKLQMRNEAILRKLHKLLHKLQQTRKTVKN